MIFNNILLDIAVLLVWAIGVAISISVQMRTPRKHYIGDFGNSNVAIGSGYFILGLIWPLKAPISLMAWFFSMLGSHSRYRMRCNECMGRSKDVGIGGRLALCQECKGDGYVLKNSRKEADSYALEYELKKQMLDIDALQGMQ